MFLKQAAINIYNKLTPAYRFALNVIDNPAVVLLYHRVHDLKIDPQLLAVKPENFDRQIAHLKQQYDVLEVDEFCHHLKYRKKFPKKSVVLTFDDGYADNLQEALPVLENHEAQALFFVTTEYVDTGNEFWWYTLEKVLLSGKQLPPVLEVVTGNSKHVYETATQVKIEKTYQAIHRLIKFQKKPERQNMLMQLCRWADVSPAGSEMNRVMTSDEIKKLASSKSALIGAHTVTHTPLSILNLDEQHKEVRQSKEFLEKITGKDVKYFSYPYGGKKDYNAESVKVCKEAGFEMVCSNFHMQAHTWTDLFEVPRMLVRDWQFDYFKKQMSNFFSH